ncbi:MAG TPA: DJ-1/PfpI family protein [Longimicrobium sp.]|nr:DJ-1/PfpI family protein [Longimicrobium sp.]
MLTTGQRGDAEEDMDQQTVHLFILDGMADWEPSYAVAGINQAAFQTNPGRYTVKTVGPSADAVRTMGGLAVTPDLELDQLAPEDSALLILPGATAFEQGEHSAAAEKAREFLAAGVPVAAICGATMALAQRGILDGRPHTSNAAEYLAMQPGYAGGAHYVDAPALRAGDLVTASAMAPVDFARAIFERLELYAPEVTEAWYALYRHGDPAGFYALQASAGTEQGAAA